MAAFLYAALFIFAAGNLFRIARIASMPVHLRWELYPIPPRASGKFRLMAGEVVLLRRVWEHHRRLWVWSWLLHWGLYLITATAALSVLTVLLQRFAGSPVPLGLIAALSWISVACGVIGAAGLIALRSVVPTLRILNSRAPFANLGAILLMFGTGVIMLAVEKRAACDMVSMAGALLMFWPAPSLSWAETLHVCCVGLFLAYFPFTHMPHMYLKYFTFHSIQWDDAPLGPTLEKRLNSALDLPVGWAAPHIRHDGRYKWRAVATEGITDGPEKARN